MCVHKLLLIEWLACVVQAALIGACHPFCGPALEACVARIVDSIRVPKVANVSAMVADALRRRDRVPTQPPRRIGVLAVVKAGISSNIVESGVLVVWADCAGSGGGRATKPIPNFCAHPVSKHGSVVNFASAARQGVERLGRSAIVWRPPSWIENALECSDWVRLGHGLHAEASALRVQRWFLRMHR